MRSTGRPELDSCSGRSRCPLRIGCTSEQSDGVALRLSSTWSNTIAPVAEIEITAGLIRDLLRDQHHDLAELPIRQVEGGWGNQMWRLGDELAVRIQHMDTDPGHQLKERRWLPLLAPRLPLPNPVPVRNGAPSERSPKVWTVMTWVPGLPLDHRPITRGEHAADTLAAFLRALHVAAPSDAPVDTTGHGAHPKYCTDGFNQFFYALDADAIGSDAADVRAVWYDAIAAPAWEGPPV